MPRDFFKRAPRGELLVGGTIITDVQASLNAASAFNITPDGIYGQQTVDALSGFQGARGLPVTGTVSDATWSALMRSGEPSIVERCLQVVASFEGTGFTLIEGNFDGAGLTWGIIGFTLVNGELGQVLAEINSRQPALFSEAFGADADHILQISGPRSTQQQRTDFANSITGPKFRVAEPWRTFFSDLGKQREVQRIQIERAREKYWTQIALRDVGDLGLTEELDLLLLFDVAVQDGGMRSKGRLDAARGLITGAMSALDRRRTIAQVVGDSIGGAFRNDVLSRKMCIAAGRGVVHSSRYSLDAWGFLDGSVPTSVA